MASVGKGQPFVSLFDIVGHKLHRNKLLTIEYMDMTRPLLNPISTVYVL